MEYVTESGSTVKSEGGRSFVNFDWVEEDACVECKVDPAPREGSLFWDCEECGGGSARLLPLPDPPTLSLEPESLHDLLDRPPAG